QDRHPCLHGNEIEPFLPLLHRLACTLWCDAQVHPFACTELIRQDLGQRSALSPFHRYAAYAAEKDVEGEEEPLCLDQEVGLPPQRVVSQLAHHEVPVAGVGCHCQHAFWNLGESVHHLPSHDLVEYEFA